MYDSAHSARRSPPKTSNPASRRAEARKPAIPTTGRSIVDAPGPKTFLPKAKIGGVSQLASIDAPTRSSRTSVSPLPPPLGFSHRVPSLESSHSSEMPGSVLRRCRRRVPAISSSEGRSACCPIRLSRRRSGRLSKRIFASLGQHIPILGDHVDATRRLRFKSTRLSLARASGGMPTAKLQLLGDTSEALHDAIQDRMRNERKVAARHHCSQRRSGIWPLFPQSANATLSCESEPDTVQVSLSILSVAEYRRPAF